MIMSYFKGAAGCMLSIYTSNHSKREYSTTDEQCCMWPMQFACMACVHAHACTRAKSLVHDLVVAKNNTYMLLRNYLHCFDQYLHHGSYTYNC